MKACIHRGAHEIGGNCIELEHEGARILLELGWPLAVPLGADLPLPEVPGLRAGDDSSLLGVIISHPHLDHFGLLAKVAKKIPVFMGEAAARILGESAWFSTGLTIEPSGHLRHRQPFEIGPFRVTPYLIDHSAFDAYSVLVEAGGRKLFYTGDIRAHGRKSSLFEELLAQPPRSVHVLLMEGTNVQEAAARKAPDFSEADVEARCVGIFRDTQGMVLAFYSPQNIDRLVSLYRATMRSGRTFVMDLYTAAVAAATGRDTIPQAEWERVRVYLPWSQKKKVLRDLAFERTNAVRDKRIYPEELRERKGELVMTFRYSMAREVQDADFLEGAHALWSLWPGYLSEPAGEALRSWLDKHGIPLTICHTSGHTRVSDLQRLVGAMEPERVVPIHTSAGDRFAEFFPQVDRQPDGQWWDV